MPKIDIDNYIEQSGMRKARFGGYEPDDVRQAMRELCADYEQHMAATAAELRAARQENEALRRHAQTLVMQNQNLSTQNASLAGQVDKLQSYRANLETQFSTVKERNHSLTNQLDVLRLKNSDLTRENKELTEQCEEANSALRVKGRAHDQARQQVMADRDKVIADAEAEAARIRQQAKDDADQILKDTNLKAEAIDQLAREQAIAQARKMVQSATDETREIQNAHRLRLQDLKSRITEMEKTRGELMDYLADMIEKLQKTQDYASRTAPLVPHDEELAEADAEPKLDLSANKVDAAASALRGSDPAPQDKPETDTNRVVAPGFDSDEQKTNTVVTPSPDYFDTPAEKAPEPAHEEVEIPGAIFSYPILRQQGEPILDEETPPPQPVPHKPLMPSITLADDDEDGAEEPAPAEAPAPAAPQPKPQTKRRRKAVMALRALHRKIGV
ncbi:hypothetical protein [Gemmiger sp.]